MMLKPPSWLNLSDRSNLREWILYYESRIDDLKNTLIIIEESIVDPKIREKWLEKTQKNIESDEEFLDLLKRTLRRLEC